MLNDIILVVESPGKIKKIESLIGCKCVASKGHIMDLQPTFFKTFDVDNINPKYSILKNKKCTVDYLKLVCKKYKYIYIASDSDREGEAIAHDTIRILGLDVNIAKRITFNEISKTAILESIKNPRTLNMNFYHSQQARRIIDMLFGYTISPLLWNIQPKLSAGRCQSPAVKLIVDHQKKISEISKISINSEDSENPEKSEKNSSELQKKYKIIANLDNFYNNTAVNCKPEIIKLLKIQNLDYQGSKIFTFIKREIKNKKTVLLKKKTKHRCEQPKLPLNTSDLQQIVYNKFKINPAECMKICQKLYESSQITYHRTESNKISDAFKDEVKIYIEKKYGKKYCAKVTKVPKVPNTERNMEQSAETAPHEAIRPISVDLFETRETANNTTIDYKIYCLILNHTIASQMSDAENEDTEYIFGEEASEILDISNISDIKKEKMVWTKTIPREVFDGFKKHMRGKMDFSESSDDFENYDKYDKCDKSENIMEYELGSEFTINKIEVREVIDSIAKPYTPASLIKKLTECKIGKPSTFTTIVDKILDRGYIYLGDKPDKEISLKILETNSSDEKIKTKYYIQKIGGFKNGYIASATGLKVTDFLEKNCNFLIETEFTKKMEESLDKIAEGKLCWMSVIRDFYYLMKKTLYSSEGEFRGSRSHPHKINWVRLFNELPNKAALGTLGTLGTPGTGEDEDAPIYGIINGKYGLVLAKAINGKIVKFNNFPPKTEKNQNTDIKLAELKSIFKYPKKIGIFENNMPMIIDYNSFGWFIIVQKKKFQSVETLDISDISDQTKKIYVSKDRAIPSKEIIKNILDSA